MKQYQKFLLQKKYWKIDRHYNLVPLTEKDGSICKIFSNFSDSTLEVYSELSNSRVSFNIPAKSLRDSQITGKFSLSCPNVSYMQVTLSEQIYNNGYGWDPTRNRVAQIVPPSFKDVSFQGEALSLGCHDFIQLWMPYEKQAKNNKCPTKYIDLSAAYFSIKLRYLKNFEELSLSFNKVSDRYNFQKCSDITLANCPNLKLIDLSKITPEKMGQLGVNLSNLPDDCIIKFPKKALAGIGGFQCYNWNNKGITFATNANPTIYMDSEKYVGNCTDFQKYENNSEIIEITFKDLKTKLPEIIKKFENQWKIEERNSSDKERAYLEARRKYLNKIK